jgi:hypothetical protein
MYYIGQPPKGSSPRASRWMEWPSPSTPPVHLCSSISYTGSLKIFARRLNTDGSSKRTDFVLPIRRRRRFGRTGPALRRKSPWGRIEVTSVRFIHRTQAKPSIACTSARPAQRGAVQIRYGRILRMHLYQGFPLAGNGSGPGR